MYKDFKEYWEKNNEDLLKSGCDKLTAYKIWKDAVLSFSSLMKNKFNVI